MWRRRRDKRKDNGGRRRGGKERGEREREKEGEEREYEVLSVVHYEQRIVALQRILTVGRRGIYDH